MAGSGRWRRFAGAISDDLQHAGGRPLYFLAAFEAGNARTIKLQLCGELVLGPTEPPAQGLHVNILNHAVWCAYRTVGVKGNNRAICTFSR